MTLFIPDIVNLYKTFLNENYYGLLSMVCKFYAKLFKCPKIKLSKILDGLNYNEQYNIYTWAFNSNYRIHTILNYGIKFERLHN